MSLDAAKALLANQAFQEQVLANLSDIGNVFSATPDLLKTVERGLAEANLLSLPGVVVLPEQEVTPGELRPEQAILGRVSDINAYLEAHPDQAEAVGFVLAAAQGPKGLMMWAASQALADTPFGEQVAQYQAYLEGVLGKAIAEGVEGHDLDASYENDAYLLGGGGLIGTLLVGAVAGASNSKAITVKGEGAKGASALKYVDEPPFNSAGSVGAAQLWSMKGRIKHVELPTQGKIRYVPPESYNPSSPLPRGPNNGYIDKFGNEWTKGPSRTQGQAFEWDVQLSKQGRSQLGWATRDGSHLNVSLDGKITHK